MLASLFFVFAHGALADLTEMARRAATVTPFCCELLTEDKVIAVDVEFTGSAPEGVNEAFVAKLDAPLVPCGMLPRSIANQIVAFEELKAEYERSELRQFEEGWCRAVQARQGHTRCVAQMRHGRCAWLGLDSTEAQQERGGQE